MKEKGLMYDKCVAFSIRIVKLKEYLATQNDYVMGKQILRSGTSIGANYSEALSAESNSDFVHKLKISMKEIFETQYWLDVLVQSGYIDRNLYCSLTNDSEELRKLFASSIITASKLL